MTRGRVFNSRAESRSSCKSSLLFAGALSCVIGSNGLAYFTDVGHYLIWVYLSYDGETYTTDQPSGRVA